LGASKPSLNHIKIEALFGPTTEAAVKEWEKLYDFLVKVKGKL
jgi:hypothetical protein